MIIFVGYLASAFLAISLIVTREMWFRWVNLCGCLTFVLYGYLIDAFPVILANGILAVINIVQIVNLSTHREHFEYVQIHHGDDIVESFIKFYQKDLRKYFPDFRFTTDENRICFMVLRNALMANLFVARKEEDGAIVVEINYTIPKFRDYKVGKFIFDEGRAYLQSRGVKTIFTKTYFKGHTQFLKRMGFTSIVRNNEQYFEKSL
ncbi:MAG TPA: hypothetical protein VMU30_06495 [Bacteroidota bacterium]|nr:hypothetical protein [Bacteroidota bacterium]